MDDDPLTTDRRFRAVAKATSAQEVIAQARATLATARLGLEDMRSRDATRRNAGLQNVVIFGRIVTWKLQNLRSIDEAHFDDWYEPLKVEMGADALLVYFRDLRTEIEKQMQPAPQPAGLYIKQLGPNEMAELQAHAPPHTTSIFLGDPQGRSGYEVTMPDGTVEKVYFRIPERIGHIIFDMPNRPSSHLGRSIADASMEMLCKLYLDYMEKLIDGAERHFAELVPDQREPLEGRRQ
ncbi:MAG TPA: hypothetical protein VGR87_02175 [Candidatus Limnocylindria bacterium]|nr:hypothetical protein [Candidatus Limnocylindria bacterium]